MTRFPIPDAALDDRLAILGTSGSGKTYLTTTAIERLLSIRARIVAVDPLGVMWGLRLKADGVTPSGFNIPIFGGKHGDLPLNEHAGALIGETVATMAESCIIDLSELPTKSAERRFMTAFLEAVYRHTDPSKADPYHLIIDEADRFAPQKPPAGDETMLNRMEEIVRRGRAKGFIPWLITQRPAVLNKNVLSQADGLVMLKLTSSQDRDQVGAWIEGQADRAQGKAILGSLPTMQRGQGVVWIPGRGILETLQFPQKTTFDSSASPKRGEKKRSVPLRPLDLGRLKERLTSVEAETKANDPATLKAEIARLKSEIAKGAKTSKPVEKSNTPDPRALETARKQGHAEGVSLGWEAGEMSGFKRGGAEMLRKLSAAVQGSLKDVTVIEFVPSVPPNRLRATAPAPPPVPVIGPKPTAAREVANSAPPAPRSADGAAAGITGPQQRMLDTIAFWNATGDAQPTVEQVVAVCGYSLKASTRRVVAGALVTNGLIYYPEPGRMALTDDGRKLARSLSIDDAAAKLKSVLSGPQAKMVEILRNAGGRLQRDQLIAEAGYSPTASTHRVVIGALSTLKIIHYPEKGVVQLADWAREVLQ